MCQKDLIENERNLKGEMGKKKNVYLKEKKV